MSKNCCTFALEMLITTKAIVLNLQRHGDHSHILHTYTQSGGRVNFLVYGAGSKKKSAALYAPLTVLEVTADIRPDRPISTLKEAHLLPTSIEPLQLPTENSPLVLTSIKIFIAEMLYRILRHPMADETLYDFLEQSITLLRHTTTPQDFHAEFLVGFASRLGFAIDDTEHPELLRTPVSRTDRQLLLRQLCDYYAQHVDDFQYPLSLDVLMEVFD